MVHAYRSNIDAQRIRRQAIEHSEQSMVSALQEQSVSQSEMVEQRDDTRRRQIVDLTTELAMAEGRSEEHRELNSARMATADLRFDNYRLELAAEQSRSRVIEMEGRQLATQLQEEVDHHMRYFLPAPGDGPGPCPPTRRSSGRPGSSPGSASRGPAICSDAARYYTVPHGRAVGVAAAHQTLTGRRTKMGNIGKKRKRKRRSTTKRSQRQPPSILPPLLRVTTFRDRGGHEHPVAPLRNRGMTMDTSGMDMFAQALRAGGNTHVFRGRAEDAIKVGDFPSITMLAEWKRNFVREHSATAGRMDDETTAWVHLVLNLWGMQSGPWTFPRCQSSSDPPTPNSPVRALEAMCKRHGEQKNGTFDDALLQTWSGTKPRRDPSCRGKCSCARFFSRPMLTTSTLTLGC